MFGIGGPKRPKMVAFDVIGTVFPLEPLRSSVVALGLSPAGLEGWFAAGCRDAFAMAAASDFEPFTTVLEAALEGLLAEQGLEAPAHERRALVEHLETLDARDGTRDALALLVDACIPVMALSNDLFGGVYMSRALLAHWRAGQTGAVRWIVAGEQGVSDWAREGEIRAAEVPFRTMDGETMIAAARENMGMAILPCFVGDADPLLVRVPSSGLHQHGTLWLLTQGETRKTKRVRLFTDFLSGRLAGYAALLAGLPS